MRRGSAIQLFLGGLLVVAAVAAVTFGVVQALDLDDDGVAAPDGPAVTPDGTETGTPEEQPLAPDEVEVTGVATGVTVEGASVTIDVPLVAEGGTAVLTDVEVDGQLTDVVWHGGRPFDLRGDGSVVPQTVNLFAAPHAVTAQFVDGVVNELTPGSYALRTPVAVGREGVAQAYDGAGFASSVESTLVFIGGTTTSFLPRQLELEATGRVRLEGTLEIRRPDDTTVGASVVELADGGYRLTALPRPDATGYDVRVVLQGDVTVL